MVEKVRRSILLAKVETNSGVDASPSTTDDVIVVYDLKVDPEPGNLERPDQGLGLSRLQEVLGNMKFKISFSVELKGSGAAGTAPKGLSALLQASGMAESISAGVSVTYAPAWTSMKTATLYAYKDGRLYKCLGTALNASFEIPSGERAMVKFEGESLYTRPIDSAFPSSYTPNTTVALAAKNMTVSFDSYAPVVRDINFSLNNVVTPRPDQNADWGFAYPVITDRNPGGEITIEAIALATKDLWAHFDADTLISMSVVLGATAGNIVTITAPYARMRNIPDGDADGINTHPIGVQFARTPLTDGSELSIVFT